MATTQYIGSRYVPLFADPAEWNSTRTYEPLTIVLHEGNSYTSKQYVPKGVDIANGDYWAETGNYNAQVEQYRKGVEQYHDNVEQYHDNVLEYTSIYEKELVPINQKLANIITPEMYGAIGDGVTDDTAALQAALDSVSDDTCLLLTRVYGISKTITASIPSTKIIAIGTTYSTPGFVSLNNMEVMLKVSRHGLFLNGVSFNYKNEANTTTAIEFDIKYYSEVSANANTDASIKNCSFNNTDIGIKIRGRNVHIFNTTFSQNRIGVYILTDAENKIECRNTIIDECKFHSIGEFSTDGNAYGVYTDKSVLNEYSPHSIVIRNCFVNFCNVFYYGLPFVRISDCEFYTFRNRGDSNMIAEVGTPNKSNLFNETFYFVNNRYAHGSISDTHLDRALVLRNVNGAYIANNELTIDTDLNIEIIFGTNCSGIIIIGNYFLNRNGVTAYNFVSNSTGLGNGNVASAAASSSGTFFGLTDGVNYTL